MYLIFVSLFLSGIGLSLSLVNLSEASVAQIQAKTDIEAKDFLAYRASLISFRNDNLGFSGTITSSQYTPYLKWGDVITGTGLGNIISSNTLIVWSTSIPFNGGAYKIYDALGGGLQIGYNRSGTLYSLKNTYTFNTGIALPSTVPNNAFVVYGD